LDVQWHRKDSTYEQARDTVAAEWNVSDSTVARAWTAHRERVSALRGLCVSVLSRDVPAGDAESLSLALYSLPTLS
jgi:hypothetical protein